MICILIAWPTNDYNKGRLVRLAVIIIYYFCSAGMLPINWAWCQPWWTVSTYRTPCCRTRIRRGRTWAKSTRGSPQTLQKELLSPTIWILWSLCVRTHTCGEGVMWQEALSEHQEFLMLTESCLSHYFLDVHWEPLVTLLPLHKCVSSHIDFIHIAVGDSDFFQSEFLTFHSSRLVSGYINFVGSVPVLQKYYNYYLLILILSSLLLDKINLIV